MTDLPIKQKNASGMSSAPAGGENESILLRNLCLIKRFLNRETLASLNDLCAEARRHPASRG
jgi:hypothetical protein